MSETGPSHSPVIIETTAIQPQVAPEQVQNQGNETLLELRDLGALALNGIRRAVTKLRLDNSNLEKIETSARIHREVPATFLSTDAKGNYSPIPEQDTPVTLSQRRQRTRNSRRKARADVTRTGRQYRQRRVWGDDIGTPRYEARVTGTRMGVLDRFRHEKAHAKFQKTEAKSQNRLRRTIRSAAGEDIPGRILRFRATRHQRLLDRQAALVRQNEEIRQRRRRRRHPDTSDTKQLHAVSNTPPGYADFKDSDAPPPEEDHWDY